MHKAKPEKDIYEQMMKEANILPEETFFIDDSAINCQAAISLGIQSYHYHIGEDLSSLLNNEIISDINHQTLPPSVATIGFFDGVHRGHRFLINQVKEVAAKDGLYSALITFPVHPRQVIQTAYRPQLLSSPTEKLELLETMQVDYCFLLPFTQELSLFSAREFMQLLRNKFNIHTLVIGYDHRFGHNRSENFEDYCRYGEELNIYIVRARAYTDKEGKISSSVIRQLLKEGEVSQAAKFLGYNYYLDGTVVDGYKVGRKIGFPTANLQVDCSDKLIPSEGVYAVYVYVEGKNGQEC